MEVVLIELADEGGEVGVLEHAGEDGLCELVHVLDDEAVAVWPPGNHICEGGVFEHPNRAEKGDCICVSHGRWQVENQNRGRTCTTS